MKDAEIADRGVVARRANWIGTPYHHQASVKGVGTDCLGLVRGVFASVHGRGAGNTAGLFARLGAKPTGAKHCSKRRHAIWARCHVTEREPGDVHRLSHAAPDAWRSTRRS